MVAECAQRVFQNDPSFIQERLSKTYEILLHGFEKCKEAGLELGDYETLVALYKDASLIQESQ